MFDWFEKQAPIRVKFKALAIAHAAIAATSVVLAWLGGAGVMAISAIAVANALMVGTVLAASRMICTPYVTTVVRMEALAAGDTTSPVLYTDHKDCVGRMTAAMRTFTENAVEVQQNRASQESIVNALSAGLRKLRENDLTFTINTRFPSVYEGLREDFNCTLSSLATTFMSVRNGAASVLTGATEIRAASDDLSQRNEQQAARLEQTSAAMNSVTVSIKDVAESAKGVQQAIDDAHSEATEGGRVVQDAIAAMSAIEMQSEQIFQIINVIDGIAFQTNLLALNAGVEAARAGDAGKGFAVVANEVRALAQRSADAARDIKELITASSQEVAGGVRLVGETGQLLEAIVKRVGAISKLVVDIAASTRSQADNLQQVNGTVGEMDRMTQQNAAMVEQSTASARSLADEANQLATIVNQFRLGSTASEVVALSPDRKRRKPAPQIAVTRGNLALQSADAGADWAEF